MDRSWLSNLGTNVLTNIAILLARNNLPELVSNLTSNAINQFERKLSGKGAVRAGQGINDVIKIIKSLEDSSVLVDGITETAKHEIKKKTRRRISWSYVSTFSCFFSVICNFFISKRYKWKGN